MTVCNDDTTGSTEPSMDTLTNEERDLLQAHQPGYGNRSATEVAFNLVNATVGAGIIGLPYALYHAGFFSGLVLSVFVSLASQFGLYMLIVAGQRVGIYKFATLVEYVLGRPGFHFLNAMILTQAGGACLSYIILIGDTLPVLLGLYLPQYPFLSDRTGVLVFISIFLILPLNLFRSIGALARWSILSVLCLPIIILTLLIRAPVYSSSHDAELTLVGPDLFGAIAIMAFGFACSQVAFNNFLALKEQTSRSWTHAIIISAIISYLTSMAFSIIGYLSFGKDVEPNLFLNFPADDTVINIGRFALGFSMILTVPMGFYVCRDAIQKSLGFETPEKQPTNFQHYGTTLVLSVLITVLGIYIRSVGKVYSLIGGVASTTLTYILPAATYLATRSGRDHMGDEAKQGLLQRSVPSYHSTGESSTHSSNDTQPPVVIEEEPVVIDLSDGAPCWHMDLTAGLLVIWGLVVMFFATKSVLTQP